MGHAARLRALGIRGKGIGDGNPRKNELMCRMMHRLGTTVRFSDRLYVKDATGTFRRVALPIAVAAPATPPPVEQAS